LRNADLRGAYCQRVSSINQRGIDLQGTNLEGANLENSNLKNANLENVKLKGANLSGANLSGANLRNTKLWEANLDLDVTTKTFLIIQFILLLTYAIYFLLNKYSFSVFGTVDLSDILTILNFIYLSLGLVFMAFSIKYGLIFNVLLGYFLMQSLIFGAVDIMLSEQYPVFAFFIVPFSGFLLILFNYDVSLIIFSFILKMQYAIAKLFPV
jgi:hypothetical protein